MKQRRLLNILYLSLIVFYLLISALAFIFTGEKIAKNNIVLGMLLLFSSIPHLLIFVLQGGIKNYRKISYLVFSLIGIVIGLVTICKKDFDLEKLCIIWGTFDICRSSFELVDTYPELKNRKFLELVEIAVSLGEIVIAILLIIDGYEGIRLHIYYLAISFAIMALKLIIANVVMRGKNA